MVELHDEVADLRIGGELVGQGLSEPGGCEVGQGRGQVETAVVLEGGGEGEEDGQQAV